jgi:hypothetical protein
MPWWGWVLGVFAGLAGLLGVARRSFRSGVRREVLEELRQAYRDLDVLENSDDHLLLKSASTGEVRINFANLYFEAARSGSTPGARLAVIRRFLSGLHRQAAESGPLSLDRHGERLLPRLVPLGFIQQSQLPLPHRPLGDTGLTVAYVLDQPTSVAYLHRGQLRELGLDEDRLHERCLANLARGFPEHLPIEALRGKAVRVHLADSHDATRLLLLPRQLQEGQALAVLVPDSDTLLLMPVPGDADWKKLAKLARAANGKPVLPGVALRVTSAGIERT